MAVMHRNSPPDFLFLMTECSIDLILIRIGRFIPENLLMLLRLRITLRHSSPYHLLQRLLRLWTTTPQKVISWSLI